MAKQPDPWRSLVGEIAALKRQVAEIARRSPWFNTGSRPNGVGGIDSNNYVEGVSGFRLAETPEFNDIRLRGGIIGNDALSNPVSAEFIYDSASNFGLTNSIGHIKRHSVTVPAGFTSAIVNVTCRIYAINPTAGLDYLYCQTNIAGYNGIAMPLPVSASGGSGFNVSPFAVLLSGLTPGSTFFVDIDGQTAFGAWAADLSNQADVSGSIIWFR